MADIEPRVAMLEANIRDMIASLARIEEKQKATATREEMGHLRGMADDRSHGFLGRGDGRDRVRSNAALFRARQTHATAQQAEAHVEFEFYETYVGLYSITTEFDSKTGEWTSRVTLGHRMADPRGARKLDDHQLNHKYSSEDEAVEGHAQIAAMLRASRGQARQ